MHSKSGAPSSSHPLPRFSRTYRLGGSDGIFLGVGGRPVSGPEQEVTDTNGPEEGQMVWLARAQSGQARPSQPWGQERTKVQVESGY